MLTATLGIMVIYGSDSKKDEGSQALPCDSSVTVKKLEILQASVDKLEQMQKFAIENAAQAFEKAKTCQKNGNIAAAKRYMLNAINNYPSEFSYLKYFTDLILNDPQTTLDDLNGTINLIDALLSKLPVKNMDDAIEIRNNISKKSMELLEKTSVPQIDLTASVDEILNGKNSLKEATSGNKVDIEKLKLHIDEVTRLLSEENLSEKDRKKLLADLEKSSVIHIAMQTLNSCRNSLNKSSTFAKKEFLNAAEILIARNQLSTANTLLTQIWVTQVPDFIEKQAEELQKEISEIDEKLNKIASKPAIKKYDEIMKSFEIIKAQFKEKPINEYVFRPHKGGDLTQKLKEIQKIGTDLTKLSVKIYDEENREKFHKGLQEIQEITKEVAEKRYAVYQMWATKRIEHAFDKFDAENHISNDDAHDLYVDYLMDIDRGLLSYCVGECFDYMYQKVYDQLHGRDKRELSIKRIKNNPVTLENF